MASGQLGNTFRTGYRIQQEWVSTPDVAGNYSTVTSYFYLISLGSTYNINASAGKALNQIIDGTTYPSTVNVTLAGNQKKLLATNSKIVYHNQDGTKKFSIGGNLGINVTLGSTYYGTITIPSQEFDLDNIPRATTPTLSHSTREMGQAITISVAPAVSSFSHKHYYSFTGIDKTLIAEVPAGNQNHDWTIPLETLAPKIPNSLSGTVTITTDTYNGATLIGSKSVLFAATIPDYQPSASLTLTPVDQYSGKYVQNKSKLTVAITAAGLNGSTISSRSTKINGATYTGESLTTDVLKTAGTNTVETTVIDSRGKTRTVTQDITVTAYSPPQLTVFTAKRTTAGGVDDPSGNFIKATVQGVIASIDNTNTKNTIVKYKKKSDSTWTTAATDTTYTPNISVVFAADANYAYDVQVEITDHYGTIPTLQPVAVGFELMDFYAGGRSMAIGKVAEGRGVLDVRGDTFFEGQMKINEQTLEAVIGAVILTKKPIGSIEINITGTNPGTYLGGTWVAWGSGRVPVGVDTSQSEFNTVEETGGAKTHTLTANQSGIRDHRHEIRGGIGANAGSYDDSFARSGVGDGGFRTGLPKALTSPYGSNGYGSFDITEDAIESHNNLQPYITCYMWKRTA